MRLLPVFALLLSLTGVASAQSTAPVPVRIGVIPVVGAAPAT